MRSFGACSFACRATVCDSLRFSSWRWETLEGLKALVLPLILLQIFTSKTSFIKSGNGVPSVGLGGGGRELANSFDGAAALKPKSHAAYPYACNAAPRTPWDDSQESTAVRSPGPFIIKEGAEKIDLAQPLAVHFSDAWVQRGGFARQRFFQLNGILAATALNKAEGAEDKHAAVDRFTSLHGMNVAGKECLHADASTEPQPSPVLVVCADASGGVGVLESMLSALTLPCLVFDAFLDPELWVAERLEDVAHAALQHLQASLPHGMTKYVFAGVGFGGVLAHALAVHAQGLGFPGALILLEGAGVLVDDGQAVDWVSPDRRVRLQQLAAQAFDASVSLGRRAVSKEALLVRLTGDERRLVDVLKLLSTLCPNSYPREAWAARIETLLLRLAIMRPLTERYAPDSRSVRYEGQASCLLQLERGYGYESCIAAGGPDHCWAPVLGDVAPMATFLLPEGHPRGGPWEHEDVMDVDVTLRYIVRLQDKVFRARSLRLVAALEAAALKVGTEAQARAKAEAEAELQRRIKEEEEAEAQAPMVILERELTEAEAQVGAGEASSQSTETQPETAPTYCLIEPLNDHCLGFDPTGMDIVAGDGEQDAPPFWMFHTETGDMLKSQRSLADLLHRPCFGLALGPDIFSEESEEATVSMDALAAYYCDAILSMQPTGPYYLVATGSVAGGALAHACASRLERNGLETALFLIDSPIGWTEHVERQLGGRERTGAVEEPDTVTYALYYYLKEAGTLRGSLQEFNQNMRRCHTPWEQLKLIDSQYRPKEAEEDDELALTFDEALYDVLERCAVLKKLLKRQATARSSKSHSPLLDRYDGPGSFFVPRGLEAFVFERAAMPLIDLGGRMDRLILPYEHSENLLRADGRRVAAQLLAEAAVRARSLLIEMSEL